MTALDLLDSLHIHEVQALPAHRFGVPLSPAMKKARFRGFIWVNGVKGWNRVTERADKVIPNTTRKDLLNGDYGGAYFDDGYWIVCDSKHATLQ